MTQEDSRTLSGQKDLPRQQFEKIARALLTQPYPVLYMGSSHCWGWNETDPRRKSLLSRIREMVPGMDLVHVPERKSIEGMGFSPGVSIFAGIPYLRLDGILSSLRDSENRPRFILVLHDNEPPLSSSHAFDHLIDSREEKNLELLLGLMEDLLRSGTLTPWGHTPEGKAYREKNSAAPPLRKNWSWEETKDTNIPEEFRHELISGLDEHAE